MALSPGVMNKFNLRIPTAEDTGGEYIRSLIAEGEHERLDFKFQVNDSKKIARTLCAFSNTSGGRLLVGVKDNGAIAGMRSEEEYYMIQAAAEMYSRPKVQFTAREWEVEGRTVLEVIIPRDASQLYASIDKDGKYKVFTRVKDQNFEVNNVWLKAYRWRRREAGVFVRYSDKEISLFKLLEQDQLITLPQFCKISGISYKHAENILAAFIALDVIEMVFSEKGTYYRYTDNFLELTPEQKDHTIKSFIT